MILLNNLIELYPRFVIKVTELFTNEFTLEKLKIKFKSKISGNRDLNNYLIEELNLDYSVDSITATDIEFLAESPSHKHRNFLSPIGAIYLLERTLTFLEALSS